MMEVAATVDSGEQIRSTGPLHVLTRGAIVAAFLAVLGVLAVVVYNIGVMLGMGGRVF